MTKKIMTIIGARPQFIKAAALSRVINNKKDQVTEYIVHTGQHYDYNMSDVFFKELAIPTPDKNLHVGSGSHGAQTGEMLRLIEAEIMSVKPDMMLVYGDTNSTLAGALAASKLHIPVAHVEAGLRSFNKAMPEEINRVLTDHVSDLLFVPTTSAVDNLKAEGITGDKVKLVGDVMNDAIKFYGAKCAEKESILRELDVVGQPFIFATIHRAENTNDPKRLLSIFNQLDLISRDIKVVLPLHPRTKGYLKQLNFTSATDRLRIIEPVGYLETLLLQRRSALVVTDSGGVQKEAFINGKYCVTVRPETEWIELVHAGYNVLAEPVETLTQHVEHFLKLKFEIKNNFTPYGNGDACDKILNDILNFLK